MRSPHIGQGSNSVNVRRYNERLLLKALRREVSLRRAARAPRQSHRDCGWKHHHVTC